MKLSPGVPHLRVPWHLVVKGTEPFPRRVYGVLQYRAVRPYSSECVEGVFSEVACPSAPAVAAAALPLPYAS
jgi:hypothetical protein